MQTKFMTMVCFIGLGILTLGGCKEQAQKQAPTLPKVTFDAQKAQETAKKQIIHTDVEAPAITINSAYLRVLAQTDIDTEALSAFFKPITSDKTQAVVILATIHNGAALTMPSVPLLIFEKRKSQWHNTFAANGPISPYFVAKRAPLDISLELVLLQDKLDGLDADAQKQLESYTTQHSLYSKEGAYAISSLADAFAQRIALVEEASFKELSITDIAYLEHYASALSFTSPTGAPLFNTTLSVKGKNTVLPLQQNQPLSYSELMTTPIAGQTPRSALGDLESGFWSIPPEALRPGCDAISGALQERLGLSRRDSAIILWAMMQPHALFGEGIDYNTQCSGPDIATLLNEAGLSLPPINATTPTSRTVNEMNKSLSHIASLVKNGKDSALDHIANLMTDKVVVRDEARLLFSAQSDQLVSNTLDVVAPALDKANAAQYLMMLPIRAYGCYSRGRGQTGYHRATLAQLENDPNLWQINFAFNDQNKINGIQLKKPTQLGFCRAIGKRTGANQCRFSGKDFPGLSADRCG